MLYNINKTKENKMKKEKQLMIVKVGTDDRPASAEDIETIRKSFEEMKKGENNTLITHHAINVVIIPVELIDNVVVTKK